MKQYYHIHDDWGLIRTCLPMVSPDDEITYRSLDGYTWSNDLTLEDAQAYCANPVKWAVDNDLTKTDGGVHDHRKDIAAAVERFGGIGLPLSDFYRYYYVLPDYTVLATDYEVPAKLIRRELEPAFQCEGHEGQLEGESDLEFYRRDPINFAFESGIATFTGFKIVEATHEHIIAQSKIITEDNQ